MSKTHKFPVTVTVGSVSYRPGADVPVGGKNGISPEEVTSIEAVHGKWSGSEAPTIPPVDLSAANARAEAESVRADAAEARVKLLEELVEATEALDAATIAAADKPADAKLAEAANAAETRWTAARAAAGR